MSYVQLNPSFDNTPFNQLLVVCEDILLRLGYTRNLSSGAWINYSFVVNFVCDNETFIAVVSMESIEKMITLSKTSVQPRSTLTFFLDFLFTAGLQIYFNVAGWSSNDHFVSPYATNEEIIQSLRTRIGDDNFDDVHHQGPSGKRVDVPKTKAGPA